MASNIVVPDERDMGALIFLYISIFSPWQFVTWINVFFCSSKASGNVSLIHVINRQNR